MSKTAIKCAEQVLNNPAWIIGAAIIVFVLCGLPVCQAMDDPCDHQACKTGGTCTDTQEPLGYTRSCQCGSPFQGTTCSDHVVLLGTSVQFQCPVKDLSATTWLYCPPDGCNKHDQLSQGGNLFDDRFNFSIINSSSIYYPTLTFIGNNAGLFICKENDYTVSEINLTVEVPPVLHLKRDDISVNSTINVLSGEEVTIDCIAGGSPKPPVNISIRVEGKTGPYDHPTPNSEGGVATFRYVPAKGDSSLTCVASGQQVIPEYKISVGVNVQYPPDYCVIDTLTTRNEHSITCKCGLSNPVVNAYEIYVNGTLNSTQRNIILPSDTAATVFCIATNDVGSSRSELKKLKPFPAVDNDPIVTAQGIAIGIAICIAIGIVFCIIVGVMMKAGCIKCTLNNPCRKRKITGSAGFTPSTLDKEDDVTTGL